MRSSFLNLWNGRKPVIGMVHLKALPGSPSYKGEFSKILDAALKDADMLIKGGVDGLQIENQFDIPYFQGDNIGPETVAFLTAGAIKIKTAFPEIPLGINVHLNGAIQAVAVAKAAGADFIRCFNLMNAYISNSGYTEADAPRLMRYKRIIDAEGIMVFGDFQVKHGSHAITGDRSIEEKAHDIQVCGADAAILTGTATGVAPDVTNIQRIRNTISIPLLVGSGLNSQNAHHIWPLVDGAIIGSSFKENNRLDAPVDFNRVKQFMELITGIV